MELMQFYQLAVDFLEFVKNHPLGQARDFGLAMIDVAQPVAQMGSQCFWV